MTPEEIKREIARKLGYWEDINIYDLEARLRVARKERVDLRYSVKPEFKDRLEKEILEYGEAIRAIEAVIKRLKQGNEPDLSIKAPSL
ncbi:hypothetical protein DRP04_02105 [Archaeoglobales archaeon]|nr:MAG: hypothetical protein DRP04_02105 [Archaeoglobales archaeon]